jgi:hypothetical protein
MFKLSRLLLPGAIALGITLGNAARAAQSAQDPAVAKDLTSVIALLGLPCGAVVKVQNRGENDNLATCRDGNRYRVYVNADGRVVADKQK